MATDWEFKQYSYTKTYHREQYPAIDPKNPPNSAEGKVVVVTGGGAGIGKHIATAFVLAGAKAVAILGRRANLLEQTKSELEAAGQSKILTFTADVSDAASLDKAFAAVKSEVGPINVLVANAGYLSASASVTDIEPNDWWKGHEVNVKGTFHQFRAFAANMSEKQPTFISLNTGVAHAGIFPGMSSYASSKIASAQLVSYIAAEHPQVRAVSFHPGVLETEMNSKSGIPLSLDDMSLPAGFAVWLASPRAEFTNGRMLWAHWDVDELEAMKDEIVKNNDLVPQLQGFKARA